MDERQQLEQAIAWIESQRAILTDPVADASLAALREKVAALTQRDGNAAARPRRRYVTILFADITDFTAITEGMDVEDVSEAVNALWARVDRHIVTHGGTIDKHMGDGLMAMWGWERTLEDDAERAIRAALAIQADLEGQPVRGNGHVAFKLKIALNSGPAFLSELGTLGEYTAVGDAVNTASRMEKLAPGGGVIISHETYRHVRGLFEVQPLDVAHIRGKSESVQLYRVMSAKPRIFGLRTRGVEGVETAMVGRERELAHLQKAFQAVTRDGRMRWITISGESGLGKSRLLYEFERWTELQPETYRVFKGTAQSSLRLVPFSLLRDLFAFRFQVQDSDPTTVAVEKIEHGLSRDLGRLAPEHARQVAHLLGFGSNGDEAYGEPVDAPHTREQVFGHLCDFFAGVSEREHVAILLEDIHWADGGSLDWVQVLARRLADRPVLLICLARPELLERRADWLRDEPASHLALQPLLGGDLRRLLRDILRRVPVVPEVLEETAVARSDGNPFYLEELVKTLIDDGVIDVTDEVWRIDAERLLQVRVPPTLVGVLVSRLERLPRAAYVVLERAAVIGHTFWDEPVAFLSAEQDLAAERMAVSDTLDLLEEKELIYRHRHSTFAGTREYCFKHMLLREVVYERVLRRQRAQYHAQAARWFMTRSHGRAGEFSATIAGHLERAGQNEWAAHYLHQAGERAQARFANEEAVAYYSRALELLPERAQAQRYALLMAREQVYSLQGKREAQRDDLDRLQELVDQPGARKSTYHEHGAEIALRRARFLEITGAYRPAIQAAEQAIGHAEAVGDQASRAGGYLLWGRALWRMGQYEQAQAKLEQALEVARGADLRRAEADILRNLGIVLWHQGRNVSCRRYIEQALPIYQGLGDRRGEASALNNLGVILVRTGDYAGARAAYERALAIKREIGDRQAEATTLHNLSDISARYGLYEDERRFSEQALAIYREVGDRNGEARTLYNMALLFHNLGDHLQAAQYGTEAVLLTQTLGDRAGEAHATGNLGRAYAAMGQWDAARDAFARSLALRQELGQENYAVESRAGLAQVALAEGDVECAQTLVDEILEWLTGRTFDNTGGLFEAYLVCCRVLLATGDPRADNVIRLAQFLLQEQAERIADEELRRTFLERVQAHAGLLALTGVRETT